MTPDPDAPPYIAIVSQNDFLVKFGNLRMTDNGSGQWFVIIQDSIQSR